MREWRFRPGLVAARSDRLGAQSALRHRRSCRPFVATAHPSPLVLNRDYTNVRPSRRHPGNAIAPSCGELGYEALSCYGSADYKTPNLDDLAAKGMRFTHCYSQPICTPSRVQIMTGRYNHRNYEGFGFLSPKEKTFGNLLKEAGYATCVAGRWQLSGNADTIRDFGFDEHCVWNMINYKNNGLKPSVVPFPKDHLKRYAAPVVFVNGKWQEGSEAEYGPQVAADFLCSFIERNKKKPFFCYYPMWDYGRRKKGAREFVRDRRWRLCNNGRLCDLQNDVKKRTPVTHLSAEAEAAKRKLENAFKTVHEN